MHDINPRTRDLRRRAAALLGVFLVVAEPAAMAAGGKKPRLDLRATPQVRFSPQVLVVAELVGGEELEEFYCPGLEWDWDDGARSTHEGDCAPFQPGMELERLFSARHAYAAPGEYVVRVTMRRASRSVAVATTRVTVRSGFGPPLQGDPWGSPSRRRDVGPE